MIILALVILLVSLGVGFLMRQDMHYEARHIQPVVVDGYQEFSRYFLQDGFRSLFDPEARASHHDLNAHPPGYSLFVAFIFYFFGDSDLNIQISTILFNGLSAVIIFLIAEKLLSPAVGFLTGLIAAVCPQLASNSVLLLPDTLAIFPLLVGIYCWVLAFKKPRFSMIILTAVWLGISCWLRANAMFLPFFLIISIPFLFPKGLRLKYAGTLLGVFILTMLPNTIRNTIIYKQFVPVSLGSGHTLLEGIADYDTEKRFGIPATDVGIIQMEARKYDRPDYVSLYGKEGPARDKMRFSQGLQVIRENPVWFGGVMFKRALSMLKLERVVIISPEIPVTRAASDVKPENIIKEVLPAELLTKGTKISSGIEVAADESKLTLKTDNTKKDAQFASEPLPVEKNTDYLAAVDLRLLSGRVSVKVEGVESKKDYNFVVVDVQEVAEQPRRIIPVYFVTDRTEPVQVVVYNEPFEPSTSVLEIQKLDFYNLGSSSTAWTRPVRWIVNLVQRLYITAVALSLAILGLIVLMIKKQWQAILILITVPLYYMCFQSILHTEYRYVIALHYFLFVMSAFFLTEAAAFIKRFAGGALKAKT